LTKTSTLKNYDLNIIDEHKIKLLAGIDEVGRGPLAGPVVVAAVILDMNYDFKYVNDSKQLSEKKRNLALDEILKNNLAYTIIEIDSKIIDKINILEATKQGMLEALNKLSVKPDLVLIDYVKIKTKIKNIGITKGDSISLNIAAASVLAKTHRDSLMKEYAKTYKEYGFDTNMGYGTKEHIESIKKYGITDIHRLTFEPIKSIIKQKNNLFNL